MKISRIVYGFLAVSVLTALLSSLSYLFQTDQREDKEELYFTYKLEQANMQLKSYENSYKLISKSIYDNIIHKDKIIAIIKKANFTSEKEELVPLRQELYEELLPLYKNLDKQNIRQLHFHLQGNTSFLRFHRPHSFGDSLIGVRYSVDKVNRTKIAVHGFEEGRTYNGFRNVYPVLSNKRLVGTVEISYSFNAIRDEAQKIDPAYFDFILKRSVRDSKVLEHEQDNYVPTPLSEKYLKDKATLSKQAYQHISQELIEAINQDIAQEASIKLEQAKPFILQSHIQGEGFLITFIPVQNVENKQVAYFISYHRDDIIDFIYNDYIFQLQTSFLMALIFSFLLVMYFLSLKRSADIQEDLATTDPLTKIANRNKLNLVMNTSIQTAQRYDLPLSVIFFDIDLFKQINDKLGHDTGDDILVELSALVTKQIRLSDLLARWGGEEFMIVLPETDHTQAAILAEKLRALIDGRFFGVSIHLTCSFGVTQLHKDDDEHTLFKRVDVALYSAKERGRNKVVTIE